MFTLMADAMRLPIQDPLAKWLLVTLCDYANDKGECWPSTITLAERTGMHRASVARKLNDLEQAGYIHRTQNAFKSNIYRVALSDIAVAHSDSGVAESDSNLSITNKQRKKRCQIPDDWTPSTELIQSIDTIRLEQKKLELNHDHEAAIFRDHHKSKGSTFIDVDAAYRTWCRRSFGNRQTTGGGTVAQGRRSSTGNTQSDRFSAYLSAINEG